MFGKWLNISLYIILEGFNNSQDAPNEDEDPVRRPVFCVETKKRSQRQMETKMTLMSLI